MAVGLLPKPHPPRCLRERLDLLVLQGFPEKKLIIFALKFLALDLLDLLDLLDCLPRAIYIYMKIFFIKNIFY